MRKAEHSGVPAPRAVEMDTGEPWKLAAQSISTNQWAPLRYPVSVNKIKIEDNTGH